LLARKCREKKKFEIEELRDSVMDLVHENKRLRTLVANSLFPPLAAKILDECRVPGVPDYLRETAEKQWEQWKNSQNEDLSESQPDTHEILNAETICDSVGIESGREEV
jgi:hypothetical protein